MVKSVDVGVRVLSSYGENVFNDSTMRKYLTKKAYKEFKAAIGGGRPLPDSIADDIAKGMKKWALRKGATHYTHWFQPMTGLTAEKHDSFIHPVKEGKAMLEFSGRHLTKGEPDASSFPSGGIRATFEARGYTAWDPTSPAFIKYTESGPTLCIPTAFFSYHGEALDKKTPLLRSIQALEKSVKRLIKMFDGRDPKTCQVELGPEQEYFLIRKDYYLSRPDLVMTGRTLYGSRPAKHQQMEDHYFGSIKEHIIRFMEEVQWECWRLGIPVKTRHNEVAPAQFEIAPVYESLNLAVDHNMMVMHILQTTAEKHGLTCLLHEKPFAGVNGSGKHNNWSISADGKNLLDPGNNPHENAKFLTVLCAILRAVNLYSPQLRASVACAGNDHRLGANEAPPAIISVFLGGQLTEILENLGNGASSQGKSNEYMRLGVTSMPEIPKDTTDRNRTSPFAFTGNKFEFRAVGSSQSCAGPNMVLNTIIADSIDYIVDEVSKSKDKDFNIRLQNVLRDIIGRHKRIIFNGDNYSRQWAATARDRGLPNVRTSDDAISAMLTDEGISVFEKYGVMSKRELEGRYRIFSESYEKTIDFEGNTALEMGLTQIMPAANRQLRLLSKTIKALGTKNPAGKAASKEMARLSKLTAGFHSELMRLEAALKKAQTKKTLKHMENSREYADRMESLIEDKIWPLPKYREILFL
jgi:glutamine synthetase